MIRFKMVGVKFRFVFGRSTQSSVKRFVETIITSFLYPEIINLRVHNCIGPLNGVKTTSNLNNRLSKTIVFNQSDVLNM